MTGRTLEALRAESQQRVDARPRPTDRVRQLHRDAAAAFLAESQLATPGLEPAGEVGYRLRLPAWHQQREPNQLRQRRGKPTTWRPIFDALSLNARVHWSARQRAVATVRGWVALEAGPKRAALPEGDHLTVQLVYRPAQPGGSRDGTNLQGLAKPCVDGLARGPRKTRKDRDTGLQVPVIGLDLVPDDCEPWLTEERPLILDGQGPERSGLWLDVVVTNPRGVLS